MGPPKLLLQKNGWSWLLNPIKQATAGLVSPIGSQIRVTGFPSPGNLQAQHKKQVSQIVLQLSQGGPRQNTGGG